VSAAKSKAAPSPPINELIAGEFATIGRAGMAPAPRASKVADAAAWEYWVASLLLQLAERRREAAKRAATVARVLPDYINDPYPVGTVETVYSGPLVSIALKVVPQPPRVDVAALLNDLADLGVKPATLKRLVKKHTIEYAGAHVFTATLAARV
jgi:hypothetical protein